MNTQRFILALALILASTQAAQAGWECNDAGGYVCSTEGGPCHYNLPDLGGREEFFWAMPGESVPQEAVGAWFPTCTINKPQK